jgi:hypothetical protein
VSSSTLYIICLRRKNEMGFSWKLVFSRPTQTPRLSSDGIIERALDTSPNFATSRKRASDKALPLIGSWATRKLIPPDGRGGADRNRISKK